MTSVLCEEGREGHPGRMPCKDRGREWSIRRAKYYFLGATRAGRGVCRGGGRASLKPDRGPADTSLQTFAFLGDNRVL